MEKPHACQIFKAEKNNLKSAGIKKISFLVNYFDEGTQRYRVYNLIEELTRMGIECVVFGENIPCPEAFSGSDLLVACRVLLLKNVADIMEICRKNNIPVIYDIDDLMFEPELVDSMDSVRNYTKEEKDGLKDAVSRMRDALLASDYVTCTTASLCERISRLNRKCFVIPNTINNAQYSLAEKLISGRKSSRGIRIGYQSGTNTHNRDFAQASGALYDIMKEHENVEFHLIGKLDIDPKFSGFGKRFVHLPFMPYMDLLKNIADLDINIAPLELDNVFTDAKSELKIFEAGLVEVPTIASRTRTYSQCITHGKNGFLAGPPGEWHDVLKLLVENKEWRVKTGREAREDFLKKYYVKNVIDDVVKIYEQIIAEHTRV